ncbi:MAG: RsmE family RNA methyltransferase, partial [Flavobacteriaceae bacterium]
MQQFYTPEIDIHSKRYVFNDQESKHIARVLRKSSGETVRLTNGKGHLFWGTLEVLNPKRCSVKLTRSEFVAPSNVQVHMAVAPTKNMDRFEWFLEKATELGVHR